jgi:FkbM family methyltransferase
MRRGLRLASRLCALVRARRRNARRIWIDVGAYRGERSLPQASTDPTLLVFAFEPNLPAALHLMGRLRNYVVLPMAIALKSGSATLHVTEFEPSSSLLAIDEAGRRAWIGGEQLSMVETRQVPTIRLDEFMGAAGIEHVSFLKVDAQGADLDVVRSAGNRLKDIQRVEVEVSLTPLPVYKGACSKDDVIQFFSGHGFTLVTAERQSYGQEENLTFVNRHFAGR